MRVCLVVFSLAIASGASLLAEAGVGVEPATFARDVAPLVFAHCSACHTPNGAAPFSLLTYAEVRGRARQILDALEKRTMPPWKPEPGFGEFAGTRRLSDEQIARFRRWVETGMLLGNTTEIPSTPQALDGWQLGKPDAILSLPSAYRLPATGGDRLRNFVIPTQLDSRRYVRAWEFRTSNPRVVHHATIAIDSTRASRRLDEADAEPGYEGLIPLSATNPDGFFLGWTPGQSASVAAAGTAWALERDSDLNVMLHLRPTGQSEEVDITIGLYFSETRPTRTPAMIRLNRQDIDIPPGEARYTVADSYTLPVGVDAIGIQPHAHTLATEIKGFATFADGTRQWLIYIRRWDFHWQDAYRFESPIHLPAGTRLTMEYTYDNSSSSPANRGGAPKRVTYGQRTTNEMADLWIQVLPTKAGDLPSLTESLRRKLVPQHIAGYRMMLEADPENPSLHDDLALLLFEAGDLEASAREFAESLRLKPTAAAHYNAGNALLPLRRFDEAARHFRDAVAFDPRYAPGHFGLGLVHEATGHDADALEAFTRALALRPDWDEARIHIERIMHR